MIYTLLQTHWEMVKAMRIHQDPEMRECGRRWLAARATTLAPHRIQVKAIRYALRGFAIQSKQTT